MSVALPSTPPPTSYDGDTEGSDEPITKEQGISPKVEPPPLELSRAEVFGLVVRHMRKLAGAHSPDLDDLIQAAAEQTLKSLPNFEGRSSLSTWIYRICYLTLLDYRRWHKRWFQRFSLSKDGTMPDPIEEQHAGHSADAAERNIRIWQALEQLSPKLKSVLVLFELEGLSVRQVAEIVDTKEATVRTRLRDARRRLVQILSKDSYFQEWSDRMELRNAQECNIEETLEPHLLDDSYDIEEEAGALS